MELFIILIFLSSSSYNLQVINCFAEWYIEPLTCRRDFKADEVIMNYKTIEADKSRYPNIQIEIIDGTTANDEGGGSSRKIKNENVIEFDSSGQIFRLGISTPYNNNNNEDTTKIPSNLQFVFEASNGGKFLGSGTGCDGRRVAGWKKNMNTVALALSGESEKVKVWAGWALGHEAITLTYPIIFRRKIGDTSKDDDNIDEANVHEDL